MCHSCNDLYLYQYAYRKCLGTSDALLDICCSCQSALDAGSESIVLSIDFSAAFDRVSHVCLLHKLQAAGVSGSISANRVVLYVLVSCNEDNG